MRELFGEYEHLPVRNFQLLWWRRRYRPRHCRSYPRRLFTLGDFPRRIDRLDPDRNTLLLLDLTDRHAAIGAIQNALDQRATSVTRPISKLRHRRRDYVEIQSAKVAPG